MHDPDLIPKRLLQHRLAESGHEVAGIPTRIVANEEQSPTLECEGARGEPPEPTPEDLLEPSADAPP